MGNPAIFLTRSFTLKCDAGMIYRYLMSVFLLAKCHWWQLGIDWHECEGTRVQSCKQRSSGVNRLGMMLKSFCWGEGFFSTLLTCSYCKGKTFSFLFGIACVSIKFEANLEQTSEKCKPGVSIHRTRVTKCKCYSAVKQITFLTKQRELWGHMSFFCFHQLFIEQKPSLANVQYPMWIRGGLFELP